MRRTRSFLGCLCYSVVPRSFWVSALSLWTVFLAQVNFRQQEGKEQTCPHDSQSRVRSFSSVSPELRLVLCSSIPRVLQNGGSGKRMIPRLPGGTKLWGCFFSSHVQREAPVLHDPMQREELKALGLAH